MPSKFSGPQIGPHTPDYRRQLSPTSIAASSLEVPALVVTSCLGFIYGTGFDSRWRYQKSPYPVRVFCAFGGRESLNSNGRLTEFGRSLQATIFPNASAASASRSR
jgi:hypothetical protein